MPVFACRTQWLERLWSQAPGAGFRHPGSSHISCCDRRWQCHASSCFLHHIPPWPAGTMAGMLSPHAPNAPEIHAASSRVAAGHSAERPLPALHKKSVTPCVLGAKFCLNRAGLHGVQGEGTSAVCNCCLMTSISPSFRETRSPSLRRSETPLARSSMCLS